MHLIFLCDFDIAMCKYANFLKYTQLHGVFFKINLYYKTNRKQIWEYGLIILCDLYKLKCEQYQEMKSWIFKIKDLNYILHFIYIYSRKFCNQLKLEKQNSYENKILTIFKYILCMYSLKFFLSKVSELKVQ